VNTAVDFAVFQLLLLLGLQNINVAQAISYSCGVVNSFFLNTRWTFQSRGESAKRAFWPFILVNLLSLGVSLGLINLAYALLKISDPSVENWVAKGIATVGAMLVNFIGNKLLVFKGR
jgi:putative flippase GtrA